MTRLLVTGGAGFIGSHLVCALWARGDEVTVLDTLSPQVHGADPENSPLFRAIQGKARFLRGSVCDADAVMQARTAVLRQCRDMRSNLRVTPMVTPKR